MVELIFLVGTEGL